MPIDSDFLLVALEAEEAICEKENERLLAIEGEDPKRAGAPILQTAI